MKGKPHLEISEFYKFIKSLERAQSVEGILNILIETVSHAVPQTDMAIVYLYDSNRQVLRLGAAKGVAMPSLGKIAFRPGESLTGKVFISKEPVHCATSREVVKMMSNISTENKRWFEEGTYRRQVKSSINVPLMDHDHCLGTFTLNRSLSAAPFSQDDLRLIHALTGEAARMIGYMKMRDSLEDSRIKEKFKDILLEGGGTKGIIALLERTLGTTFTINTEMTDFVFSAVIGTPRAPLGYLISDKPHHAFSNREMRIIHYAADVAEIDLRRQLDDFEQILRARSEVFRDAVNGDDPAALLHYLNTDIKLPLHCFAFNAGTGEISVARQIEYLMKQHFNESVLYFIDAHFIILSLDDSRLDDFAALIHDRFGWTVGTNGIRPITDVDLSYREAVFAAGHHDQPFIRYNTLGHRRLWHELDDRVKASFIRDHIGPLLDMSPEYIQTLRALIENGRSRKSDTAAGLYIHVNTLYQRLKKMETALGISFEDEEDWLNIMTACQLYVTDHIRTS